MNTTRYPRSIRASLVGIAAMIGIASESTALAQTRLLGADNAAGRLLEINPLTGASTIIGPFSHPFVASLTWDSTNRILYATTSDSVTSLLLRVDPDTGATTSVGPLGAFFMHGIEYDPLSDTLYGVASGSGGQRLYRISRTTGAAALIAPISVTGIINIAFDPSSDVMYLAEVVGQRLRTLNLTTGATTIIGPFGAPGMPFPQVGMGMAFDPNLGLFASDNTGMQGNPSPLYRIDTATGHATLIGIMNHSGVLGLAFVPGCLADFNTDGLVNSQDFFDFLAAYFASAPTADFNHDSIINSQDFFDFLGTFFAGCT